MFMSEAGSGLSRRERAPAINNTNNCTPAYKISNNFRKFAAMEQDRSQNGPDSRQNDDLSRRSIYRRASSEGGWMGLWLIVIFAMIVASVSYPLLNIPIMAMTLMIPYITYRFLRRTFVDYKGVASYSALWMQGILIFSAAGLLICFATYLYMRWINPTFIPDTIRLAVEYYKENPVNGDADVASQLQTMLDHKLYPAPISISLMWLWVTVFCGSILSLFLSAIISLSRNRVIRDTRR